MNRFILDYTKIFKKKNVNELIPEGLHPLRCWIIDALKFTHAQMDLENEINTLQYPIRSPKPYSHGSVTLGRSEV